MPLTVDQAIEISRARRNRTMTPDQAIMWSRARREAATGVSESEPTDAPEEESGGFLRNLGAVPGAMLRGAANVVAAVPETAAIATTGFEGEPEDSALHRAGTRIRDWAEDVAPPVEGAKWGNLIGEGVGSALGFGAGAVGAAALAPVGAAGAVGVGAAAGLGLAASAANTYREAKASGADTGTAMWASAWSGLIGTSEALPVGRFLKAIGGRAVVGGVAREAIVEAVEEMAQEGFQTLTGNQVAQRLYDKDRGAFDGLLESVAVGGIVGGGLGAVGGAVGKYREGKATALREAGIGAPEVVLGPERPAVPDGTVVGRGTVSVAGEAAPPVEVPVAGKEAALVEAGVRPRPSQPDLGSYAGKGQILGNPNVAPEAPTAPLVAADDPNAAPEPPAPESPIGRVAAETRKLRTDEVMRLQKSLGGIARGFTVEEDVKEFRVIAPNGRTLHIVGANEIRPEAIPGGPEMLQRELEQNRGLKVGGEEFTPGAPRGLFFQNPSAIRLRTDDGQEFTANDVIVLSSHADKTTIPFELYRWGRANILTTAERRIMAREFPTEEAEAAAYVELVNGRLDHPFLSRIREFFQRLAEFFGAGKPGAAGRALMRDLASGRLGAARKGTLAAEGPEFGVERGYRVGSAEAGDPGGTNAAIRAAAVKKANAELAKRQLTVPPLDAPSAPVPGGLAPVEGLDQDVVPGRFRPMVNEGDTVSWERPRAGRGPRQIQTGRVVGVNGDRIQVVVDEGTPHQGNAVFDMKDLRSVTPPAAPVSAPTLPEVPTRKEARAAAKPAKAPKPEKPMSLVGVLHRVSEGGRSKIDVSPSEASELARYLDVERGGYYNGRTDISFRKNGERYIPKAGFHGIYKMHFNLVQGDESLAGMAGKGRSGGKSLTALAPYLQPQLRVLAAEAESEDDAAKIMQDPDVPDILRALEVDDQNFYRSQAEADAAVEIRNEEAYNREIAAMERDAYEADVAEGFEGSLEEWRAAQRAETERVERERPAQSEGLPFQPAKREKDVFAARQVTVPEMPKGPRPVAQKMFGLDLQPPAVATGENPDADPDTPDMFTGETAAKKPAKAKPKGRAPGGQGSFGFQPGKDERVPPLVARNVPDARAAWENREKMGRNPVRADADVLAEAEAMAADPAAVGAMLASAAKAKRPLTDAETVAAEIVGRRASVRSFFAGVGSEEMTRAFDIWEDFLTTRSASGRALRSGQIITHRLLSEADKVRAGVLRIIFGPGADGRTVPPEKREAYIKAATAEAAAQGIDLESFMTSNEAVEAMDAARARFDALLRAEGAEYNTSSGRDFRVRKTINEAKKAADQARVEMVEAAGDPKRVARTEAKWRAKLRAIFKGKFQPAAGTIDALFASSAELSKASIANRKTGAKLARIFQAKRATGWDALHEFWISGILSGPQTHLVNFASNTLEQMFSAGMRVPQAILADMARLLRVHDKGGPSIGELPEFYRGLLPGIALGWKNMLETFESEMPVLSSSDFVRPFAISGKKGKHIRTFVRALAAADQFFKGIAWRMQVGAEAWRAGRKKGLRGLDLRAFIDDQIAKPDPEILVDALAYADETTFNQEAGPLAEAAAFVRRKLHLRYQLPFINIAVNLLQTGVRRTPLGTAKVAAGLVKEAIAKRAGGDFRYEDKFRDMAEQFVAWGALVALAGAMGDDDDPRITGTKLYGVDKKGDIELAYRAAPPQSIKIGDRWYSYARLDPFASSLALMVDGLRTMRAGGKDAMEKAIRSAVGLITDKTFLDQLGDLFEVATEPSAKNVGQFASKFATSWVPNIIRQPARAFEPNILETKDQPLGARMKRDAFPALRGPFVPKVDLWGREIDASPSPKTDLLYRILSPSRAQRAEEGTELALDRMIMRHNALFPDNAWAPESPVSKFDRGGVPYQMTPAEYNTFMRIAGTRTVRALRGLAARPLPKDDDARGWAARIGAMKDVIERERSVAKDIFVRARRSGRPYQVPSG